MQIMQQLKNNEMIQTTDIKTGERLRDKLSAAGYELYPYFKIRKFGTIAKNPDEVEAILNDLDDYNSRTRKNDTIEFITVYTMGELWEMLPNTINHHDKVIEGNTIDNKGGTFAHFALNEIPLEGESDRASFYDLNPCNALAELVMWCIDNGHELNLTRKNAT